MAIKIPPPSHGQRAEMLQTQLVCSNLATLRFVTLDSPAAASSHLINGAKTVTRLLPKQNLCSQRMYRFPTLTPPPPLPTVGTAPGRQISAQDPAWVRWREGWLSWPPWWWTPVGEGRGGGYLTLCAQTTWCGSFRSFYRLSIAHWNVSATISRLWWRLNHVRIFVLMNTALRKAVVNGPELSHSWKGSKSSGNVQINACEPHGA